MLDAVHVCDALHLVDAEGVLAPAHPDPAREWFVTRVTPLPEAPPPDVDGTFWLWCCPESLCALRPVALGRSKVVCACVLCVLCVLLLTGLQCCLWRRCVLDVLRAVLDRTACWFLFICCFGVLCCGCRGISLGLCC